MSKSTFTLLFSPQQFHVPTRSRGGGHHAMDRFSLADSGTVPTGRYYSQLSNRGTRDTRASIIFCKPWGAENNLANPL